MSRDDEESYRPTIPNGPTNHTPRIPSRTDFQREYLSRVKPGHGKPRSSENSSEEEHEEGCCAADSACVFASVDFVDGGAGETAGGEHADALAYGAPVEGPAAANTVEGEDADEGGHLGSLAVLLGLPNDGQGLGRIVENLPCM